MNAHVVRRAPAGPSTLAIVACAAAAGSLALLPWSSLGLVLIVAALVTAAPLVLINVEVGLWLMVGLLFFANRTEIPDLYFWGRFMPTAGLGLVVLAALIRSAGRLQLTGALNVAKLLAAFSVLLVLSTAYNGSTPRDFVLSTVTNLRYPIFFLALVAADLRPAIYRRLLVIFVGLTLLQLPIALIQFANGLQSDFLSGSLGTNGNLLAVTLISQCGLLAYWVGTRSTSYLPLVGVVALLIPALFGDVQATLVFLPVLAAWLMIRAHGVHHVVSYVRRGVPAMIALAVTFAGVQALSPTVKRFLTVLPEHFHYLQIWSDPAVVSQSSVGRITVLAWGLPLLFQNPVRIIWGFGPEAASGGLLAARTVTSAAYADVDVESMGSVCQALSRSGVACREAQSFKAVMEFGLFGTGLYVAALVFAWHRGRVLWNHTGPGIPRAMALFFDTVGFLYVVLAFWYAGVWRLDGFAFPFWLIAAATVAELRHLSRLERDRYELAPMKG